MFYSCCSSLYSSSPCARQEYLPHLLSAAESEEPFLLPYSCGGGSKKISHAPTIPEEGQVSGWHGVRWNSHLSLILAGAQPAPDACFEKVNAAGDIYGNCGKDIYGNYRKCDIRYKAEWQPRVAHWRRWFYMLQNDGPADKTDPCIGSLSASWESSCIFVGLGALTAEAFSSPFSNT